MTSIPLASMSVGDMAHAIQLALAPVFLLTGIAGLLNAMTGRLARIIDRGRRLTEVELPAHLREPEVLRAELECLEVRRRFTSTAITACTTSALLVCVVVAALFLEVLLQVELRWLIGVLFTLAMVLLVVGLGYFLREVHLATLTVRIPLERFRRNGGAPGADET